MEARNRGGNVFFVCANTLDLICVGVHGDCRGQIGVGLGWFGAHTHTTRFMCPLSMWDGQNRICVVFGLSLSRELFKDHCLPLIIPAPFPDDTPFLSISKFNPCALNKGRVCFCCVCVNVRNTRIAFNLHERAAVSFAARACTHTTFYNRHRYTRNTRETLARVQNVPVMFQL